MRALILEMRALILTVVCFGTGWGYARGQQTGNVVDSKDAQVTFYAGGSLWKTGLHGTADAPFQGALFQDGKLLAHFNWGYFLTLRFAPGTYVLSASETDKHPAENSQMSMSIVAGQHYFVRVVNANSVNGFTRGKGLLQPVPCEAAQKEAWKRIGPLDAKNVADDALPRAVDGWTLPGCQ